MSEPTESQSDILAKTRSMATSRVILFAAYVGAVAVPLYQLVGMLAWGSQDLFGPLLDLALSFSALSAVGAICGVVAAGAFFLFRWIFNLDGQR